MIVHPPILIMAIPIAVAAALRSLYSPCGLSMISTITPFGERAKGHRYALTAGWFFIGSLVGGGILGALCAGLMLLIRSLFGPIDVPTAMVTSAVLALVGIASDLRIAGLSLPTHPRQVNEMWLTKYRRWIYAGGFGVQIGAGFATYIMTAAVYLTAALAVLTQQPLAAIAVGLTFGAARGLLVLVAAPARTPHHLRQLHFRLDSVGPAVKSLAVGSQIWVVTTVIGWSLGSPIPSILGGVILVVIVGWQAITATNSQPSQSGKKSKLADALH